MWTAWAGSRSAGLAAVVAAIGCCLAVLPAGRSYAQAGPQPGNWSAEGLQLRIASINAAGQQITQAAAEQPEPQPVWRHTFGSERRAAAVRQPLRFQADVVLLHGVTSVASVRQMFPARVYHLVVSRQILQQAERERESLVPTTAIAVRRDAGLRVVAQDHMLHLANAPSGSEDRLAAGTALKLMGRRGALWVLALDIAQCPEDAHQPGVARCEATIQQLGAVDEWLSEREQAGEAVIAGGRFHQTIEATALPELLGKLARFPGSGSAGRDCAVDDGAMAAAYVLASPGSRFDRVGLDGRFEPVDEAAPESGCLLMVDVRLDSTWAQTVIRAARH